MSTNKKERRNFTESERMSYISEYLSSSDNRTRFEKRHGLSTNLLCLWMKRYQIEDTKMKKPTIDQRLVDEDSAALIARLRAENLSLHKSNRELQRKLDTAEMLREASDLLVDLAEKTYHIPVRKNSEAK